MTSELAVGVVKNACLNVRDTKGIILHSDLGSQYTRQVFESYMGGTNFISYTNGNMESVRTVDREQFYRILSTTLCGEQGKERQTWNTASCCQSGKICGAAGDA